MDPSCGFIRHGSSDPFRMKLAITLSDDLAEFVLLLFRELVHIDTIQQSLGQNILHQLSFGQAVSGSRAALGRADQRPETGLVCDCPCSLASLDRIWMSQGSERR